MSDSSAFGFGKFIPGFDFLQNLGKAGHGTGGMPPFAHWVAPTVSVQEIEKRIEELKAVQFWLEQNSRALSATVQALEVQRMTLSTLKSMNVNLGDLGKAFPFAAAPTAGPTQPSSPLADWPMSASAAKASAPAAAAPQPEILQAQAPAPAADPVEAPHAAKPTEAGDQAAPAAGVAQAMQWWGALTQQFQHIAQQAMQDPEQQQAMLKATQMGSEFAKTAVQTASEMVRQAVAKVPVAPKAAVKPAQAGAKTPRTSTKTTASKSVPARKAAAKKAVLADKKPTSAAAKPKAVAAKKSTGSKTRSR